MKLPNPQADPSKPRLPVSDALPELNLALSGAPVAVLAAPPGSGKTTLVPIELIRQNWLQGKKILMLEPRRLAARAAASRMAFLLGEGLGETVGYRIRFDSKVSDRTRIEVLTEGILTRRLQQDAELEGVGLVIFDEFHERSLHADLALALCLDVISGLREDLRILIMSATLNTRELSRLLPDAPIVRAEGRSHPVETRYLQRESEQGIAETLASGALRALKETGGDILAFLPGVGEIRKSVALLENRVPQEVDLLPLYGDLTRQEQDRAILPSPPGRRKVVFATSIAETSLTIEGIDCVVDAGWSRRPRFDPNSGLSRLETVRVSRASAEQRAGRAGRLGPGVCYRLWSEPLHGRLADFHPPEILEADLAPLALELSQWGVAEPDALTWLDPPPAGSYAQARDLLQSLEALDGQGRITPTGREMARLGLHPRLAHMLLRAFQTGNGQMAADMAAILSERDIVRRSRWQSPSVDLEERLQLLGQWRQQGGGKRAPAAVDSAACARVDVAGKRWLRLLGRKQPAAPGRASPGSLLALAYPDRIARRRGGQGSGYLLSSGRGVRMSEDDPMNGEEFLVVPLLDAGHREGRIHLAASITLEEIRSLRPPPRPLLKVEWDAGSRAVLAREEERLGALVLHSRPMALVDPGKALEAMLDGIRQMGMEALPWDRESREWQSRLMALAAWRPDEGWPDVSDEALLQGLEQWLAPWLEGVTRVSHLRRLDLKSILKSMLDWERQQRMERLVPTHLQVPSGSRKRLEYHQDKAPVLAVKLQEMFGLGETPSVCDGQIPVTLHLLSPAQRPVQVTQDLKGFWENTYSEVKKELKGRYPKHYWPDDPTTATPSARVRPKGG